MGKQVTLTVPDTIYQQAKEMAQTNNSKIEDILTEQLLLTLPPIHVSEDRPAMLREEAAFDAMPPDLLTKYLNEYVAVYQGQVVDHDKDESVLVERIDQQYPDQVVLLRQVLPHPPKPLYFRSPYKEGNRKGLPLHLMGRGNPLRTQRQPTSFFSLNR